MTGTPELRAAARDLFRRTLAAIEVEGVVRAHLRCDGEELTVGEERLDLTSFRRVIAVSIGKAGVGMARAVEEALGARLSGGLVVTNAVTGEPPRRLPVLLGGHPLPNAASFEAARSALALLGEADDERTLILFLISGGGSSLFERPIDERLTLPDLREVNRALVGCGAVIGEMNVVRRHLSAVKGGRLAAAAPRARQISLYISDVNSDDLRTVASGPTIPDTSTLADFERIVARYDLLRQFPAAVAALISAGAIPALPRPDPARDRLRSHHLLLDNRAALSRARLIAEQEHGWVVEVAEDLVEGEVEEMARAHLERLAALGARHPGRAVCLLSGGEVICPVRGDGEGGRNQEFVLRAALHLGPRPDVAVLSAGTDGIDGHSPAAGAVADATTIGRARALGLKPEDYLDRSDSYNFFRTLGDAVMTGPTGNNVRDLRVLLGGEPGL